MGIFSSLANKISSSISSAQQKISSSLASVGMGGVAEPQKVDTALDKLLREKGLIDIGGKTIVEPKVVKEHLARTAEGYDPITNLKKESTVLPLPYKESLMGEALAKGDTVKVNTKPSEQKLSPFATAKAVVEQQASYGEAPNTFLSLPPMEKTKKVASGIFKAGEFFTEKTFGSTFDTIDSLVNLTTIKDPKEKENAFKEIIKKQEEAAQKQRELGKTIIKMPFEMLVGMPMNFIDSAVRELTQSNLVTKQTTGFEKALFGEEDVQRITKDAGFYGQINKFITKNAERFGMDAATAKMTGLIPTIALGVVLENPLGMGVKSAKTVFKKAIQDRLTIVLGKEVTKKESKRIATETAALYAIKDKELQKKATQEFLEKFEKEAIDKMSREELEKVLVRKTELFNKVQAKRLTKAMEREGLSGKEIDDVVKDIKENAEEILYNLDPYYKDMRNNLDDKIVKGLKETPLEKGVKIGDDIITPSKSSRIADSPVRYNSDSSLYRAEAKQQKPTGQPSSIEYKVGHPSRKETLSVDEKKVVDSYKSVYQVDDKMSKQLTQDEAKLKELAASGKRATIEDMKAFERLSQAPGYMYKKGLLDNVTEKYQDNLVRLRKMVKDPNVKTTDISNPYDVEKLISGRVTHRVQELDDVLKRIDKGIIKTSKEYKISDSVFYDDLNKFMHARHAPERNIVHGEKAAGITTKEAGEIMEAMKAKPYFKAMQKVADDLSSINKSTIEILKEARVISQETVDTLSNVYKHHVPLNRILEDSENIAELLSGVGRGKDVRSSGLKRAKGSELEVDNIVKNIFTNNKIAIMRAEKNRFNLATLNMYRENKEYLKHQFKEVKAPVVGTGVGGKPIYAQMNDPQILTMLEDGVPTYLKIEDPLLAVALKGINIEEAGTVIDTIGKFTRFYSGLHTRFSPNFWLPNKIRDLQEAVIYAAMEDKLGLKGAVKAAQKQFKFEGEKAVRDFYNGVNSDGAKLYRQMLSDGGTTGGMGQSTKKQLDFDFDKALKENRSNPKAMANKTLEFMDKWNTISEDSTRFVIYKQALEQGFSRQKAAVFAKEASINFNKKGTRTPQLNALYMFSNASIQGSVKMLRAMKDPKIASAVVTAVGSSNFVISEWNDRMEPDWRDKVSHFDRASSLTIVIPKNLDKENFWYVNIPISWGIKPIKVMTDALIDTAKGKSQGIPHAMKNILEAVIDGYNPVGGESVVSAITPTIADIPVDIARNMSWAGSKLKPAYNPDAPASIRYFPSLKESATGRFFIRTSKFMSEHGIEISPADMNYAFIQLVGGAGKFVSQTINSIVSISKKEVPPIGEIPFVSRFLRKKPIEETRAGAKDFERIKELKAASDKEAFYLKEDATELAKYYKEIPPVEAREEMRKLMEVNPKLADKVIDIVKKLDKDLTYVEAQVKSLGVANGARAKFISEKLDELSSNKEKREYLKDLMSKKILTDAVLDQVLELEKQKKE